MVTPEEARERFTVARVATLATVDASGAPHLVPVTFAVEGETVWTAVDGKPKAGGPKARGAGNLQRAKWLRRHENVQARPQVSLLVQHWDEDWSRLWWVRADGFARVGTDPSIVEHAVDLLRGKYDQYRTVDAGGPVIEVTVRAWHGWAARP